MMRLSVRQKFLLFTVVPILGIYALLVGSGLLYLHHRAIQQNEIDLTDRVTNRAQALGLTLRGLALVAQANARTMESLPDVEPEQLYALMRRELADEPRIYGMAMAFEPGTYQNRSRFCPYVCRDGKGLRQLDIAAVYDYTRPEWEWYVAPRGKRKPVWTQPYYDEGAGNTLMTTYSVPFFRNGRVWGVATIDVQIESLQASMGLVDSVNGEYLVVTEQGRYLSQGMTEFRNSGGIFELARLRGRPDMAALGRQMVSGQTGIVRMPHLNSGAPYWWAYAPVATTDWGMAMRLPESRILEPVKQQLWLAVLGLGISLLSIILTVWSVSHRVTRPLAELEAAAGQMARGDLDIQINSTGSDEIAALGRTFSAMARQLALREESLRDSRGQRLAQLLEGLGGKYYFYSLAPDGTHNYVSSSVETALGYTPAQYQEEFRDLFTLSPLNEGLRRHTKLALSGGTPPIFDAEMLHRDGRKRRFEICERPLLDKDGAVISVEGLANDVTERRLEEQMLREAQQRFQMASVVGGISYWSVDLGAGTSWIDGGALRFLPPGVPGDRLLAAFAELIIAEDQQYALKNYMACAEGRVQEYESEFRVRPEAGPTAGHIHWIFAKGACVAYGENGRPTRLAGIFLDVTERHLADEALRASEARLAKITDTVPGFIFQFLLRPDGRMTLPYASQWCQRVLGLDPSILADDLEPFLQFIHPEDRDRFRRSVLVSARHLSPWQWEGRFQLNDGRILAVQGHSVPEKMPDESILWNGVLSDISALKRTEEALRASEERANSIIHSMQGGYIRTDLEGTVQHANPGLAEILGYDSEEQLVGKNVVWDIFVNPDDRDRLLEILSREHAVTDFEFEWKRRDGSRVWVEDSVHFVYDDDGEPMGMEGLVRDITTQREARAALEAARKAADEANQAKSDFLANMSHEIRTPMNAILGMTHLTLHTELNEKQRGYVQRIDSSARNLLGIINDILDFSKIEAGRLDLEAVTFPLENSLRDLADMFAIRAVEKGVELLFRVEQDVPSVLIGDPLRLGQVLTNLVSNALKFTDHGEVEVMVSRVEQRGKTRLPGYDAPFDPENCVHLQFSVRDTGIGLSSAQKERLFQSFTQADTSITRKYGGTGLGLTICRRLVHLMGGEIEVESAPNQGSVFRFTACLGLSARMAETTGFVAGELEKFADWQELAGKRALVVDDNDAAREILGSMLVSFGFEVVEAASGEEGLEYLLRSQADAVDVVFLDWSMPGWDGVETARRLTISLPHHARPHLVMVTAYGKDEILRGRDGTPFQAFLSKPVSPSLLSDAVQQVFGQRTVRAVSGSSEGAVDREAVRAVRGASILLVEDNEINQEVATHILQNAGVSVTVVPNGQLALDMLEVDTFDGVLMDLQMPGMDGYETTRRLRAQEQHKALPIIAMTANAMVSDREKCLAAGMNDHVAKPLDIPVFFATLARWIRPSQPKAVLSAGAEAATEGGLPLYLEPDQGGRFSGDTDPVARFLPAALHWNIPGLDLGAALARVGYSETLLWRLLSMFLAGHTDVVSRLRTAMERGEREAAARLLHNLKGVAGNVGARDVMHLASRLEAKIRAFSERESAAGATDPATVIPPHGAGEDGDWRALLGQLEVALEPVLEGIMQLEEQRRGPTPKMAVAGAPLGDKGLVRELLARLDQLLGEDDSQARLVVQELRPQLAHTGFASDLTVLEHSVDRYDFEGARQQLHHWQLYKELRESS